LHKRDSKFAHYIAYTLVPNSLEYYLGVKNDSSFEDQDEFDENGFYGDDLDEGDYDDELDE
jgi:hypothetical protein